jgi:eukaryotic-like serine/threonine-protein kinase
MSAPELGSFDDLPKSPDFDHRYDLRELIGSGGAGEVHLLSDRWIGRHIALKSLRKDRDEGSTPQAVERFFREARLQGQLEHPSIVPVYDVGTRTDGTGFFTMKLVRGRTLEDIIFYDPPPSGGGDPSRYGRRRLLEALVRICLAVDYAHAHGIVHRDLKPGNIMLGEFGEVYVLDWGVAKVVGDAAPTVSHRVDTALPGLEVTDATNWMGTPGYMAPEQTTGGEVGPWTDVYALGVIMFEILAREPLHDRDPLKAVGSTRKGVEARLSVRRPDLDLPPELDAVLQRCVCVDPQQRYPSARAMAHDLERVLDGERDETLRLQMAKHHTESAQQALASLESSPSAEHESVERLALRNLGRALALDPQSRPALDALHRLMLRDPERIPPEVSRAMADEGRQLRKNGVKVLFWRSISWAAVVPLAWWVGITRPAVGVLVSAGFLLNVAVLAMLKRSTKITDLTGLMLLGLTTVLLGSA